MSPAAFLDRDDGAERRKHQRPKHRVIGQRIFVFCLLAGLGLNLYADGIDDLWSLDRWRDWLPTWLVLFGVPICRAPVTGSSQPFALT